MKFSSGKPVKNAKMVSEPMLAPLASGQPTPSGGAKRGTMAGTAAPAPRSQINENRGMVTAKPPAPTGPHISDAVRADLGKLTPELAAGIRAVADRK
jgi:hypothetical protein